MAKLGKKEWAGILIGLGGSALVALIAAPELPAWSIYVLIVVAGLSFTRAAFLLKGFAAPVPIVGPPVKVVIVLLFIWIPLFFLLKKELPGPSFPYIKPAVVLDPRTPNSFWVFFVVVRGKSELYNTDISFQDMIRSAQVADLLKSGNVSTNDAATLMQSESTALHYAELDPNPTGANDNEVGQFYWRPPTMDNERYDIVSKHRKGVLHEELYIKKIGNEWQYAVRVTDVGSKDVLIECRDPHFPVDKEWKEELPKCFPNY